MKDHAAIAGVGTTQYGKLPDHTPLSLAVEAFKNALNDSGIDKHEIDGLLTFNGTAVSEGQLNYLRVGETLGISPALTGTMYLGGATAGSFLHMASMAVSSGQASAVACIFSDSAKTGGSRFARASGWGDPWSIWGLMGAASNSAITASRHMALYGTTEDHLAEVAVACRRHASMNPQAVMRDPITIDDHHASRWIVEPLRLLDCCLISDGAVCVIVTSPERAKDTRAGAVHVSGIGQAHSAQTLANPDWWYVPHQKVALDRAYAMAGVGPQDVDVAQFYDNFTMSVLLWLEHGGFCEVGEGGPFVEGGRIQLGGSLPVNTAGGNLSEAYMQGWLHIVEAVRQVRGECGDRQVPDVEVSLVTGRGMVLNTAVAAILSRGNL